MHRIEKISTVLFPPYLLSFNPPPPNPNTHYLTSPSPPPAADSPSKSELLLPPNPDEEAMDLSEIAGKLGLSDPKHVIRKAEELRRLSDVHFNSSIIGVGEVQKAIICLEIAATRLQLLFDRQNAIKLSGMSEKAYNRSFNAMQNGMGIKTTLDVRELAIQFGCVRLIPFVQKGLSLFKERFLAALPVSRRASADFSRPVFTATAFYLCAKRHKVSTSMKDTCFDVFGITKEKKDPKAVKGHRELLDVLPGKRKLEDDGDVSEDSIDDDDGLELPSYKRHKRMEKLAYEEWKTSVIASNHSKAKVQFNEHVDPQLTLKNWIPRVMNDIALQDRYSPITMPMETHVVAMSPAPSHMHAATATPSMVLRRSQPKDGTGELANPLFLVLEQQGKGRAMAGKVRAIATWCAIFLLLTSAGVCRGCDECKFPPKEAPVNPFCPMDTLKLGVCANLLGGAVGVIVGSPPYGSSCCTLLQGLADLDVALCICTALKANVLGLVNLDVPVALSLLVSACGRKIPDQFKCI
ncbi:Origin of replication complex subunit 6 [Asimina triloba]